MSGEAQLQLPPRFWRRMGWTTAALILLVLVTRVFGCFGQGYPFSFYKDETFNVEHTLRLAAQRTLDPNWFNKPALGYYIWLAEYGMYYGVGRLLGTWQSPEEFGATWFADPGPFLLIGRLTGVAFALATVLLLFKLGCRLYGKSVGIAAALLLIGCVGHVGASQEVKKDVLSGFFTLLAFLPQLLIMRGGGAREYWKSGFFAGLGTATKYHPMGLLVPLAVAHLLRPGQDDGRGWLRRQAPLLGGGVAWGLGFFLGSPFNFLNGKAIDAQVLPAWRFLVRRLEGFWALLMAEPEVMSLGGAEPGTMSLGRALGHAWRVLEDGRGAGRWLLFLALMGTLFGVAEWARRARPLSERRLGLEQAFLGFAAAWTAFFIAFANRILCEPRHLASVYPLLALAGGVGACALGRLIVRCFPRGGMSTAAAPGWIGVGLAAAALLPIPGWPGDVIVRLNQRRCASDPRIQALRWLEANVPPDQAIINDRDWLPLKANAERCRTMVGIVDRMDASYRVALAQARELPASDATRAQRIDWAVDDLRTLSSYRFYWTFRQRAQDGGSRPGFDVLVLDKDWFAESWERRLPGSAGYNQLWPRSPFGTLTPQVLTQVSAADAQKRALQHFRQEFEGALPAWVQRNLQRRGLPAAEIKDALPSALSAARDAFRLTSDSISLVEVWRRPSPASDWWFSNRWPEGTTLDWFVSARTTYDNYLIPSKQRVFPDWVAFYDELRANFDSYEFGSEYAVRDPGRTVRVWNLSRRVTSPKMTVIPSSP